MHHIVCAPLPASASTDYTIHSLSIKDIIQVNRGLDEITGGTAFRFSMTPDHQGVDIIQTQFDYRATNEADSKRIKQGAWSGWKANLPIVATSSNGSSVVVDASAMINSGFYIMPRIGDLAVVTARLHLDKCRSFPKNMLVTIEYHLTVSLH